MIRVGRIKNSKEKLTFPDFTPIVSLTASTPYGNLSPYSLRDENKRIMENLWQASKIYEYVPYSKQTYSQYDKTVIWEHPAEYHVNEDGLTPYYWAWRKKLENNPHPVRYPVTYSHRDKCIGALKEGGTEVLDYISARKEIYLPLYAQLVEKEPQFIELYRRHRAGENLLILEVDAPHQESLDYYRERYGVGEDFIVNNTMLATPENLDIMLNDEKHPFGHGYVLSMCLLSSG